MPRAFVWIAVGTGVLAAVLSGHLITAMAAGGPVAVPDVPAYLGIAQWVGGDGLAPQSIPFQPGYGLLLAPLVALSGVSLLSVQGEAVHQLALIVNSLAAAAAVLVAARLGMILSRRWWVAGVAGLIAAVHPSLSSASRIAWPETLLGLTVLGVATVVALAIQRGTAAWRIWGSAGLLATLAVSLHARMVVLVVALVVTAAACRIGRRAWAALGGGLLIGAAATTIALLLTDTWPRARLSQAAQLDRGLEPIATVSGQLLALGAGTVGLGLIGLIAGLSTAFDLFRPFRWGPAGNPDELIAGDAPAATTAVAPDPEGCSGQRQRGGANGGSQRGDPLAATALFVALGAVGAVLVGGWTLTGSDRADAVLYGRYLDPWAVPLAIVALGWLATRSARQRRDSRVLAVSAAVPLVACAVVVGTASSYDASPRRIMTLSFSPAWIWLDERLALVAAAALGVTLVGLLMAAVVLRRETEPEGEAVARASREHAATLSPDPDADGRPSSSTCAAASRHGVTRRRMPVQNSTAAVALVAAVVVLAAAATVLNHHHLADVGNVAHNQVTAAHAVADAADFGDLQCLAHDRTGVPEYALWLYRLEVPEIAHERVRLNSGSTSCSELVIADDDLAERCTNARHLVDEPAASWALWHLPRRMCIGL
ncbi:hypothetical protein [Candidatus Poriferisodalis sp.]|uniref:hypothetical protein n=1 Tax=Candidatus Poriferisodalis sp. TaxID=3101277 RepID=UPI003B024471